MSNQSPNIVVVGTGYVGLTTGACLAHLGWRVVCTDIDAAKIEGLTVGRVPILEAGLDELVATGLTSGSLSFELGSLHAAAQADIVLMCLPTPQDDDGSADLSALIAVAREIGPHLRPGAIVVNKSTVPVGSARLVTDTLGRDDVHVVSNPEFLREGTAVDDFLHPDRVVIGATDPDAAKRVAALYADLDTELIMTDTASAETIKYAANAYLAMKLSFVNSLAQFCEEVGGDIEDVVAGIGSDHRIGPAFLKPGPGWGGSCFPKDSHAIVSIARDHEYDFALMRGVIEVNHQQIARMVHKIVKAADRRKGDPLDGVVIGALGLTFKAGTDDLRESPALRILDQLARRGATINAYDPTTADGVDEGRASRLDDYRLADSALAAAEGAHVVAILTEWPEFAELDLAAISSAMAGNTVVDTRNLLDPDEVRSVGLDYTGVGRR